MPTSMPSNGAMAPSITRPAWRAADLAVRPSTSTSHVQPPGAVDGERGSVAVPSGTGPHGTSVIAP